MYYPDIRSDNFADIISTKAEFRELLDADILYPHQELVRRYMSPHTPYKGLLLYHSMGTGKTFTCISIAEDHYNHSGKKCIVLTKGKTSGDSYKVQIEQWLRKTRGKVTRSDINAYMSERYIFNHHISFCKYTLAAKVIDPAICDNILLVIDEIHNINPSNGCTPNTMYKMLKSYILSLTNSKVILLSGTPLVNDTKKILSILPMILPIYITIDDRILNNIEMLQSLARGYVSYYQGNMCSASIRYVGTPISDIDRNIYFSKMSGIQKQKYIDIHRSSNKDAIYSNSNSVSLFVFSDGTYGSSINVTGKIICRESTINEFISSYMSIKRVNYKCKRYIVNDLYKDDISMSNLVNHSCKYDAIIKEILSRNGQCCFVFIREVVGSGILLFSAILESLNYELYYGQDLSTITKRRRYTICVGDKEISPNNTDRISGFNNDLNIHGEYVQVMIGSSVMGESISLFNVRHFHSASPHWNDSVIEQAIRRVIRSGSHDKLEDRNKTIDIFLHAAYISNDIPTVDMIKLHITRTKELELIPLRDNLRRISIEDIFATYLVDRLHLDCSTYFTYISDKMLYKYINMISRLILYPIHLDIISHVLSLPISLVKYVISRCILYNTVVRDYYGRVGYIREVEGLVSITRNIVSYSVELEIPTILYKDNIQVDDIYDPTDFIHIYQSSDPLTIITKMIDLSWDQRISVLERSIELNNIIKNIFDIYIIDKSHLYQYRKPTKGSYKSLLVGIRPRGLSRHLNNTLWSYIPIDQEYDVVNAYSSKLDLIRDTRSINGRLYTLSTTDLILRVITLDKKYRDNRMYKRGRNIRTLSIDEFTHCCNDVVGIKTTIDGLTRYLIDYKRIIYV